MFSLKAASRGKPVRTIRLASGFGLGVALDGKNHLYVSGPNGIDMYAAGASVPIHHFPMRNFDGMLSSSGVDADGDIAYANSGVVGVLSTNGTTRSISGGRTKLSDAQLAALGPADSLYVWNGETSAGTNVISSILSFAKGAKGNAPPAAALTLLNFVTGLAFAD